MPASSIGAGAFFSIQALTSPGMTAGSIEGAGNFYLGSKQLTVGGNNLSTEVSGQILDRDVFFPFGGGWRLAGQSRCRHAHAVGRQQLYRRDDGECRRAS